MEAIWPQRNVWFNSTSGPCRSTVKLTWLFEDSYYCTKNKFCCTVFVQADLNVTFKPTCTKCLQKHDTYIGMDIKGSLRKHRDAYIEKKPSPHRFICLSSNCETLTTICWFGLALAWKLVNLQLVTAKILHNNCAKQQFTISLLQLHLYSVLPLTLLVFELVVYLKPVINMTGQEAQLPEAKQLVKYAGRCWSSAVSRMFYSQ